MMKPGKGTEKALPEISVAERRRMEGELRAAEERIALSALDALSAHIALLDQRGMVLVVNKAWRDFARTKQLRWDRPPVGANYFKICDETDGQSLGDCEKFVAGLRAVARGERDEFTLEYASTYSGEEHWFATKVTRWNGGGRTVRVVVAHENISERVRLEREILAVSAREQRKFGQELHDGLSQQLTGLKFKTSLLEYQLKSKQLPEAEDAKALSALLNEATAHASDLARGLRPVDAEPIGLFMALRQLAAATEHNAGIRCTCMFKRPVLISDQNVATSVYRIAEEAISNAIKHGKARQIWLGLIETRERISLTVRDDGVGVPKERPAPAGLGLHMMQYRTRMIGGSLEVRRNASGGTIVNCTFPKRSVKRIDES